MFFERLYGIRRHPTSELIRHGIRHNRDAPTTFQQRSLIVGHTYYVIRQPLHHCRQEAIHRTLDRRIFVIVIDHALTRQPPGKSRSNRENRVDIERHISAESPPQSNKESQQLHKRITEHRDNGISRELIAVADMTKASRRVRRNSVERPTPRRYQRDVDALAKQPINHRPQHPRTPAVIVI